MSADEAGVKGRSRSWVKERLIFCRTCLLVRLDIEISRRVGSYGGALEQEGDVLAHHILPTRRDIINDLLEARSEAHVVADTGGEGTR